MNMHRIGPNFITILLAVAIANKAVVPIDAFVAPFYSSKYSSKPAQKGIQRLVTSQTPPEDIFSEASIASSKASTFTPTPIESASAPRTTDDFGVSIPPDCDEDDSSDECVVGSEEVFGECLPERLVTLPRHASSEQVDRLLRNTENILRTMHINSTDIIMSQIAAAKEAGRAHECIYANNYVDLGKIDT